MGGISGRAGETSFRSSHSTGSDDDPVLESGEVVVLKRLELRNCLLLVALVLLLAIAWLSTAREPSGKSRMSIRPRLTRNGRPRGSQLSLALSASTRDDAPPDGRLTSLKNTLVGSREDYLTGLPLKDVGMFYLDLIPRRGRLVRAVTGGRLLWFAEFEESSGGSVFVTVRAARIDGSPSSGAGKTKVSIVRIAAKVK